jgi:hypothetical protein
MSSNASLGQGLSDVTQVIEKLIGVQLALGEEVLKLVGGSGDAMMGVLRDTFGARLKLPGTSSCCDIPEPCWMPQSLGEFSCRVCAGSTATIRLQMTNEDIRRRTIVALASGPAAGAVTFAPPNLPLGPKERGGITASMSVPATATNGQDFEAIVWVRGCRDHYLRWIVSVGSRSNCCSHDVSVCDGPDNLLHWYDHFYCPRPCPGGGRQF